MPSKKITDVLTFIKDQLTSASPDSEWELFAGFSQSITNFIQGEKEDQVWSQLLTDFATLTTHNDRIKFVFNDVAAVRLIASLAAEFFDDRDAIVKSAGRAKEAREKGNGEFAKKNYEEALINYSDAVLYAPIGADDAGKEYALALANRSAALYHLSRHEECLMDIETALANGYPMDRRQVLVARKIQCYKALGRDGSVEIMLENLKISDNDWFKQNEELISAARAQKVTNSTKGSKKRLEMEVASLHDTLPNASDGLRVDYTPHGRCIVAARDIKPSEVLFAEKPFCHWLRPSLYHQFCFHCMKYLNGYSVPCRACIFARFCSIECAEDSWNRYHQFECGYIDIFRPLASGHFALRAILTVGIENCVSVVPGDSDHFQKAKSDYEHILSLVDHSDRYTPDLLLSFTVGAVFMTVLSHKCGVIDLNEETNYVFGARILKHTLQLRCNACSVMFDEMELENGHQTLSTPLKSTGCALYSSISLLNHSCDVMIYPLFSGNKKTLKAVDLIKQGEEVTLNYGALYKKLTLEDRQEMLQKQYFFRCECKRCLSGKEYAGMAWLCPECKGQLFPSSNGTCFCAGCGTKGNKSSLYEKHSELSGHLRQALELFEQDTFDESRRRYLACLELGHSFLWPQNELLAEIHEKIARCSAMMLDCKTALKHWTASFNIVRALHREDNYDALSCLFNVAFLLLESGKASANDKKLYENAIKAKKYFERAMQICNKLVGKEYYVLTARENALRDIDLMTAIRQTLQDVLG